MELRPFCWTGKSLRLLDQRLLPNQEVWLDLKTSHDVEMAIRTMAVRGAPAIGITGAYGIALAKLNGEDLEEAGKRLAEARPTAVNLARAVVLALESDDPLHVARTIEKEDLEMNQEIGKHGLEFVCPGSNILTICNTGAFATAGHGTALGIIRTAHAARRGVHVWVCETRPRMQGLKLTTFELMKEGIKFHCIADGAAGTLMANGQVDLVVVGADRIAANGDTANKIGTYSLAVLAKHHEIPFVVAAPSTTLDISLHHGHEIPIEERGSEELTTIEQINLAPLGTPVYNPAFDVTPGSFISAIVTERGTYKPPYNFVSADVA